MNKKYIFLCIFLAGFFIYFLIGKYGVFNIVKLEIEKRNLEKRLLTIEASMIIMKHKINFIENSIKEKERIARERLGMIREGEKIIIFKEE